MSAFRQHLQNVEGKLLNPQASAMMEEKKPTKSLEHTIMENMMVAPASGPGTDAAKKLYGKKNGKKNENMMVAPASGPGADAAKKLYGKKNGKKNGEDAEEVNEYGGGMKKKKMAEDVLGAYLNDYFGGTISEDTSDDDLMDAIQDLFVIESVLIEFIENDEVDDSIEEAVNEYLSEYFGNELSEDTSDDSIAEAIVDLFNVAEGVRQAIA